MVFEGPLQLNYSNIALVTSYGKLSILVLLDIYAIILVLADEMLSVIDLT